jgi:integrase
MRNIIEISNFNTQSSYRYFLKILPVQINGDLKNFVYIMHRGKNIIPTISIYSEYFYSRVLGNSLAHKATNTVVNAHGKFIILFLNFIFYEYDKPIDKIQDLDYELIKQFLNKHAIGQLNSQKGKSVSFDTVKKCGKAVMMFVYWLKYHKSSNGKTLGLTKIHKDDFVIGTKKIKEKSRANSAYTTEKEIKYIESPPEIQSDIGETRDKAVELTLYGVKVLIDLSKKYTPNITFGIILGAFVGLRQGEVVQMHRGRIGDISDIATSIEYGAKIDLLRTAPLAQNSKDTGAIKKKRMQPIYEPFLPIVSTAYNQHMDKLRNKGLSNHLYGALFFNSRNGVMKQKTFSDTFKKLVDKFIELIRAEALKDNVYAKKEYSLLERYNFSVTFHSLRYFYTHMLETLETNPFQIMYYRGDKAVTSQNTYRSNITTIAGVKKVMDSVESELKKFGFDSMIEGVKYEGYNRKL